MLFLSGFELYTRCVPLNSVFELFGILQTELPASVPGIQTYNILFYLLPIADLKTVFKNYGKNKL